MLIGVKKKRKEQSSLKVRRRVLKNAIKKRYASLRRRKRHFWRLPMASWKMAHCSARRSHFQNIEHKFKLEYTQQSYTFCRASFKNKTKTKKSSDPEGGAVNPPICFCLFFFQFRYPNHCFLFLKITDTYKKKRKKIKCDVLEKQQIKCFVAGKPLSGWLNSSWVQFNSINPENEWPRQYCNWKD